MFIRLTLKSGDPIYVVPAQIVAAKPCYKGEEYTHTELALANGDRITVDEMVEDIDAREIGNYSPIERGL